MSATAAAAPAPAPEPLTSVPAKPKHAIGQLTTAELAREASKLQAALRRPFAETVKLLLQARLDAVRQEQSERHDRREEDTAAAKAELAASTAGVKEAVIHPEVDPDTV